MQSGVRKPFATVSVADPVDSQGLGPHGQSSDITPQCDLTLHRRLAPDSALQSSRRARSSSRNKM